MARALAPALVELATNYFSFLSSYIIGLQLGQTRCILSTSGTTPSTCFSATTAFSARISTGVGEMAGQWVR